MAEQSSAATEQVSASTQQTSASAQELAATAEELSGTAEGLETLVAHFKTTDSTGTAVAGGCWRVAQAARQHLPDRVQVQRGHHEVRRAEVLRAHVLAGHGQHRETRVARRAHAVGRVLDAHRSLAGRPEPAAGLQRRGLAPASAVPRRPS